MPFRPLSIRRRVSIALAALLAFGLVATNVVTYLSVKEVLSDRLDSQLAAARAPIERYLELLHPSRCPTYGTLENIAQPSVYVMIFHLPVASRSARSHFTGCPARSLRPIIAFASGSTQNPDPAPALPRTIHYGHRVKGRVYDPRIADANLSSFEVGAVSDAGFRYRVQAVPLPLGASLVVAAPLAPMTDTLSKLVHIEVLVSLGALVVLVGVAMWSVRIGLGPLEGMARQAETIARGDLARRIEPTDLVTEVGRLGIALNTMLAQIETAFTEKQASEARLRRFVADVSHELRTPLTSIRGYAELFRRGASKRPHDLEKAMSRIESEATRMTALVDDLMLLARLDQGRELERSEVDLVTVASDAIADAAVLDPEREVTLETDGHVTVVGDENRLRQLVANLVSNSLMHTPPGTPVKIALARSNGSTSIEVWDGGPGIPADQVPLIFERFHSWRAGGVAGSEESGDETGNGMGERGEGGSGLGLSIVKAIARAHGGDVSVTSVPGEGTTFHVRLTAVAR